MPVITVSTRPHPVNKEKRLLDSLLEKGERIPFSCRSGVCHACMMKAESGTPPARSQKPLDPKKASEGYFLACQCFPEQDMTVSLPGRDTVPAIITDKQLISPTVISLDIAPRYPLEYLPGQHIQVQTPKTLAQECYLASVSELDPLLRVHIQRKLGDSFSTWAHDFTTIGQKVSLSSARGINLCGNPLNAIDQILIAQEGHLAPLLAIIRAQLTTISPDTSPSSLTLLLQANSQEDFYCLDTLKSLSRQYSHFAFTPCLGAENQELIRILSSSKTAHCIFSGNRSWFDSLCNQTPALHNIQYLPPSGELS